MNQVTSIFVRRDDAADALRVSVRHIDRLCRSGKLEKRHSGGCALITRMSLKRCSDELLAAETPDPAEDEDFPLPPVRPPSRRRIHTEWESADDEE